MKHGNRKSPIEHRWGSNSNGKIIYNWLIFQPCCYDWRCHCGFHPAPVAASQRKGSSSPGFYDILCMGWYMLVICWLKLVNVGYILILVWFDYWFDIFWYVPCDFQTWHTREMGMTSSSVWFTVPFSSTGIGICQNPKNSWQMDVQPPKTSKCIDYVMILNVCNSILAYFGIPNSVRSLAPSPCAHSSKRLRMDPLAADELVSWKIANTAASSSWWHPNPWRNGSLTLASQTSRYKQSWKVWISRLEVEKMRRWVRWVSTTKKKKQSWCQHNATIS